MANLWQALKSPFTNSGMKRVIEALRVGWWLLPMSCLAAAIGLTQFADYLDSVLDAGTASFLFPGGPAGAREILSLVAASMMTVTGVVFSVTVLVLQQASNQYSPRVLRTFLKDRQSQVTLGIFVGTFVYALLALRHVHAESADIEPQVPTFTVWFGMLLGVASIGVFAFFIHHIAQSIRAIVIIRRIGSETRESLERHFPKHTLEGPSSVVPASSLGAPGFIAQHRARSGVVQEIDSQCLIGLAARANVTIRVCPMAGDFVPYGAPLMEIWGETGALDVEACLKAITLNKERTIDQDPAFGVRQLVDIAERALSPSTNDPTTAVQALDEVHDILRRLVWRGFPSEHHFDERGNLRVITAVASWETYVRLSVDEIRYYGRHSIQVVRRLRYLLEDLRGVAPPPRRQELDRQLSLFQKTTGSTMNETRDRPTALEPSAKGHG